ncbi:hypothetical protein Asppvi_001449 [Aspergillus pseudoviridinutans]|uniref:Uncharacterized protein n=1 Tax=Aspergillus pseudoviridinutans TaxID=1517512 RepID=A0A9P3B7K4_9EURO|nr:uncharacterized protein Asppvi_001449 [Aspergillus pseudoviridinutans]GIJ82934.1 hypothetical protein Asppvi_001449 [Aspergillus pseudoviridinutans]
MRVLAVINFCLATGAVGQLQCDAGANYCGWYLASNLGWPGIPDTMGIWACNSDRYSAAYVEHCAFNCTGPTAACILPASVGTTSSSSSSSSSTTSTWLSSSTTKPGTTTEDTDFPKLHWGRPGN